MTEVYCFEFEECDGPPFQPPPAALELSGPEPLREFRCRPGRTEKKCGGREGFAGPVL
jgi:hypothetical protein